MNDLTSAEALERLNAAAKRGDADAPEMTADAFRRTLIPLMKRHGYAANFGGSPRGPVAIDTQQFWRFEWYMAVRARLIRDGAPGWHSRRPYAMTEIVGVADDGWYEDVLEEIWPERG